MDLPKLILLNEHNGDWNLYLDALYLFFSEDFKYKGIKYLDKNVIYIKEPSICGREFSFWHIITEGKIESERIVKQNRCERIRWPRAIIENSQDAEVKVWVSERKNRKGKIQRRMCMYLEKFQYFIVLDIRKGYYLFCTAYPVYRHKISGIIKDYLAYKKQTPPF